MGGGQKQAEQPEEEDATALFRLSPLGSAGLSRAVCPPMGLSEADGHGGRASKKQVHHAGDALYVGKGHAAARVRASARLEIRRRRRRASGGSQAAGQATPRAAEARDG